MIYGLEDIQVLQKSMLIGAHSVLERNRSLFFYGFLFCQIMNCGFHFIIVCLASLTYIEPFLLLTTNILLWRSESFFFLYVQTTRSTLYLLVTRHKSLTLLHHRYYGQVLLYLYIFIVATNPKRQETLQSGKTLQNSIENQKR